MDEDLKMIKELNLNGYRFSLEWSRIEPEEGKFDQKAIDRYREFLKKLQASGIATGLTLWHWTMPLWVARDGGFGNKKIVERFSKYAEKIVEELGDSVDYWITLNEPLMHIGHGYIDGRFPPNQKFNLSKILKVFGNFVRIHKKTYELIHKKYPDAKVSIAMTNGYFTPANKYNLIEAAMAKIGDYFRNHWYLKKIKNYFDYIGVNYYHHDRLIWHPPFRKNLNKKIDDMGWEIFPEGIYRVIINYRRYGKPIIVMENGTADKNDEWREKYIREHLEYIHKAIDNGADVRGYFYWSLLDNFEWDKGFWPKFGLCEVDRKTFKRTPRPSAKFYAEIAKNNGIK